uniref:protocadherin gamma-A3-like isoform X6 n=1 Tax=Doryrhamphus excisus TaxID=161450 RepID=UPI0025AEAF63|nr:protocadherin gamma-A3-like isoform X6 [Doryrhamphus excisus]
MERGNGLFTRRQNYSHFIFSAMDSHGRLPFSCAIWRLFNGWRPQMTMLLFLLHLVTTVGGQIRYSIPEEMKKGSVIGNVAQDLGLDVKRLRSGRARILTEDNIQYAELKTDKGLLVVNDRIDREQLCGDVTPCSFSFEVILENPIELHRIIVEVLDINDHAPVFAHKDKALALEISESATVGVRFPLQGAVDQDVGQNALQNYILSPNDNFILNQHANPDGSKYVEMVLQKPLDRERHPRLSLKLIAVDGGTPQRSGTVNIEINVLDANDNEPVFNQSTYKATVMENAMKGTSIITVNATDADSGSYGLITYSLSIMKGSVANLFNINENTGTIYVSGQIDYEKDRKFEVRVEAKDQGGLTGTSKVILDVIDINDNAPIINVKSFSSPLPEDSPPGTTVAILNIKDADSDRNGQIQCKIDGKLPFKIEPSLTKYYNLISDQYFDRESVSEYNITITATDLGTPPLSSSTKLHLRISDINDNAPLFDQKIYSAYVSENNSPGISIFAVTARDADWNQNARISYLLDDTQISGSPVSTYVSLNAETGVLSAVRSFDYEQIKHVDLVVRAQDGGSPPLSSNVSVRILIQDQNDNAPQVLYPVQTGGSVLAEMVPRSADVGYLVTKVVAVDVDSGQNAWLSYKVHKATDRALFEVGLHNGEIRTVRQVTDKDAVKQRLTVLVEDNGQPSRSATVIVNVAVADSFPEVLSEFTDFSMHDKEYNDKLTFYLVLALAVVSFLFITCLLLIISVKVYRWRRSRILYHSNLPVIPYYPPRYSDTLGTGTLPHVYNYEVCRTTDSRKSDMKNMQGMSQSLVSMDGADADTPHVTKQMSGNCSQMSTLQKPPNNDWRFNQGQRPGPSGAAGGPEVAMGTGPWPQPPTEAEQLQALMAAANAVGEATGTLGPGTMGLSTRYSPQFTLQHVPDYRQNVYIPGSTATLTSNPQQQQQQAMAQQASQQALPPPQSGQPEPPKAAQTPASKKKSTKKEKK